jgi:hypothetical protein
MLIYLFSIIYKKKKKKTFIMFINQIIINFK